MSRRSEAPLEGRAQYVVNADEIVAGPELYGAARSVHRRGALVLLDPGQALPLLRSGAVILPTEAA